MNKKGFLLAEETLKIIIALIAIGLLAYLLASLYFSSKTSSELEQAKASLPFILNATIDGKASIDVYNPKSWWISYWPRTIKGSDSQIPKSCTNLGLQSCICICKKDTSDQCDSSGVCGDNSGFLIQGGSIQIKDPPITLDINKDDKVISKK